MNIENKTILITGANRGIGRALVDEALRRGAKRVYAGTRSGALQNADERVTPVTLDVTNAALIQDAVENVESLDVLINKAGVDLHDDLSDRAGIERHLAVNLFGTHGVTQAFLPLLAQSRGAIVNVLSLAALAGVPFSPAYSISKAAALSLTQSLRALWAGQGRECSCHFRWPGGYRYDQWPRYTEGLSRVRRASHFRGSGERRGGYLSRSHVCIHR
ncbi:MAG TPA: SDR family NAD(P)-dependent oxidoreductase [Terriglobales bacterium]|nr:SDR family NAD(P)-dependent oxidoreductase [Terriglobales bacterium]